MVRIVSVFLAALSLVTSAGCGGGADGDTSVDPPRKTIGVSAAPTTIPLSPGTSVTVAVSVTRSGGYDGAVNLTLEGVQNGITSAFLPASVANGSASSTLTINAATTVAAGNYNLTLRAAGAGVTDATAALTLTVSQQPSISLVVAPTSLTLARGTSGSATLTISRTNFADPVALTVTGAPTGVTVNVSPASVTGNTATLTLVAAPDATSGNATLTVTAQGQGIATRTATLGLLVPATFAWAQVSAGQDHTCGVSTSGVAYCWGNGSSGQMGDGTRTETHLTPVRVSGTQTWAQISAGSTHTCGVTTAGEAYCWGLATNGSVGNGRTAPSFETTPVLVVGGLRWSSISAAHTHTCGITTAGDGYCWGLAEFLGDGSPATVTPRPTPSLVADGHKWARITANRVHTCGVTIDGSAYCWGDGSSGQLGNGTLPLSVATPARVTGSQTWTDVNPGFARHTCGFATTGAAYCWGSPMDGELGAGQLPNFNAFISTPILVVGGYSWKSVSLGDRHSCGITTAGAAYCWGLDLWGGSGASLGEAVIAPRLVAGGLVWASIDVGERHTCGVTATGRAFCWGSNTAGRIGSGASGATFYTPVEVTNPP